MKALQELADWTACGSADDASGASSDDRDGDGADDDGGDVAGVSEQAGFSRAG